MGRIGAAFAMLSAVAVLGGCATKPEIPFDRSAANIKTIGILTPAHPDGAVVVLASSVGQSFGIIGALVDAGMRASRESEFNASLAPQNFSFNDATLKSISDRLTASGFVVSDVPVARSGHSDFLKSYPKAADTKVDAYLDVVIVGYGYIAAGIGSSTPYRPVDMMRVRLVRAQDSAVLMEDAVIYNPVGPNPTGVANAVTIPPDPAFTYIDFNALVADPDGATKGLRNCVDQSSDAVVKLLR